MHGGNRIGARSPSGNPIELFEPKKRRGLAARSADREPSWLRLGSVGGRSTWSVRPQQLELPRVTHPPWLRSYSCVSLTTNARAYTSRVNANQRHDAAVQGGTPALPPALGVV